MSWDRVLENYARLADPRAEIPSGVFLRSDSQTLTIFDGYEKAKYHFLVMPREPFKLSPDKGSKTVASKDLVSLSALLQSPHALEILKSLGKAAEGVKEMIEDEMKKTDGWVWDVQIGFHASESMRHVHLHIISSDLISPKLKNKKHYNSFHPTLGFFLHLRDVISQVEHHTAPSTARVDYEQLLKLPMASLYTGEEYSQLPKLKVHLVDEWEKAGRRAKKLARKTEEEDKAEGGGEGKKVKKG